MHRFLQLWKAYMLMLFVFQEATTKCAVRFSIKPCKSVTYTIVTLYGILPCYSPQSRVYAWLAAFATARRVLLILLTATRGRTASSSGSAVGSRWSASILVWLILHVFCEICTYFILWSVDTVLVTVTVCSIVSQHSTARVCSWYRLWRSFWVMGIAC